MFSDHSEALARLGRQLEEISVQLDELSEKLDFVLKRDRTDEILAAIGRLAEALRRSQRDQP